MRDGLKYYIGIKKRKILDNFLLKNDWPEKLKLMLKHSQVQSIEVCSSHDPGVGGATMRRNVYLHRNK